MVPIDDSTLDTRVRSPVESNSIGSGLLLHIMQGILMNCKYSMESRRDDRLQPSKASDLLTPLPLEIQILVSIS